MARPGRGAAAALGALAAASLLVWPAASAGADAGSIKVNSSSVTSEFPDGFRVKVDAEGENDITSVAIRLKVGQQTSGTFNYLCSASGEGAADWRCEDLEVAKAVDGELLWRTNTSANYIPPDTLIVYSFEIEDSEGNTLETETVEFVYRDARFEWKEVSKGPVTVAYHGPVKKRAETVLDTILETIDKMAPLLGAGSEGPIRVAIYNNDLEMLGALPRGSATIRRELITEGQAFFEMGTLIMTADGTMPRGTASHEVTHILVHRAADGILRRAPSWLQEGLAEYANVQPGFSYDLALEFAVATGRLMPVIHMGGMPGDPEDVIIFYGQARSIVRMMIDNWGIDKMREFLGAFKSGKRMDDALTEVYGIDRQGLDDMWRDSVGAPRFVQTQTDRVRPTAIPRTIVLPFSLTPQAGAEAVGSKTAEKTPTPTPEPTLTPSPVPVAAVAPEQETAAEETESKPAQTGAAGSGCNAPASGVVGSDLTTVGALLGMIGLGLRRRRKP